MKAAGLLVLSSALALLDVAHGGHSRAPRITEHPQSMVVPRHDPVTLKCGVEGVEGSSVEWWKDGAPIKTQGPSGHRVLLPDGSLFLLSATQRSKKDSDAGVYWCVARNAFGNATSRNATLEVAVLRDAFTTEPRSMRVAQGDDALLECGPPKGQPEPTISWTKDGETLDLDGSKRFRLVDGSSLAIETVHTTDRGIYQCVASNIAGSRESKEAHLTVMVKPYIVAGPEDTVVQAGSTLELPCRVGGDPLPDVMWRRERGSMPVVRVSVLDDRTLRVRYVSVEDAGVYICEADNPVGTASASAKVVVLSPPSLTLRPRDASVPLGRDATWECATTGVPRPMLFWALEPPPRRLAAPAGDAPDGPDIPDAPPPPPPPPPPESALGEEGQAGRVLLFKGERKGRFTATTTPAGNSLLVLKGVGREDAGLSVWCSAVSEVGSASWRAVLSLRVPDPRPPPVIALGPLNQTLPLRSSATLPCVCVGQPGFVQNWYKDGLPVVPPARGGRTTIDLAGTLEINDLEPGDAGVYTCVASSRAGKSTWWATLRVEAPTNPNIAFFRAPAPTAFPGPPGKPHIVNMTATTVTLSWTRNNRIGASSLLGYQVEYFGRETAYSEDAPTTSSMASSSSSPHIATWHQSARRVNGPTHTVRGLTPGLTYVFLVRAENSHGLSPPSNLSNPVALGLAVGQDADKASNDVDSDLEEARDSLLSDQAVRLVEAQPNSSTSVRLSWEILSPAHVEGLVLHWRPLLEIPEDALAAPVSPDLTQDVGYVPSENEASVAEEKPEVNGGGSGGGGGAGGRVKTDVNGGPGSVTVLQAGKASGFLVISLRPFTTYTFFAVPFYRGLTGQPSNSKSATTLEDVPTEPPTNIDAILINSTVVYIKWDPPPAGGVNGELTVYQVVVQTADGVSDPPFVVSNSTVVANAPSVLLSNLTAGVPYVVLVAASTRVGWGPWSLPQRLKVQPRGHSHRHAVDPNTLGGAGAEAGGQSPGGLPVDNPDVLTQTWFVALLGSMVTVMVLLFAAILVVWRRQQQRKSSMLSNIYGSRSNGAVLVTPLSFKPEDSLGGLGLVPPGKPLLLSGQDASLWIEKRLADQVGPGAPGWRLSDVSGPVSSNQAANLPDYSEVVRLMAGDGQPARTECASNPMPDYAEVNANPYAMTSFHGSCRGYDVSGGSGSGASCNSGGSAGSSGSTVSNGAGGGGGEAAAHTSSSNASDNASAAPYASTTLVVRTRPSGSAMSWDYAISRQPPQQQQLPQQQQQQQTDHQAGYSGSCCLQGEACYSESCYGNNEYEECRGGSVRGSEPEYAYSCTGPSDNVQRARSALDYRDMQDYQRSGPRPPGHALSASTLRRAHRQLRMLRPQLQTSNNYPRSQVAGVKRPHQSSHGQSHGQSHSHGQHHGQNHGQNHSPSHGQGYGHSGQDSAKDHVRGSNGGLHEPQWRAVRVDSR